MRARVERLGTDGPYGIVIRMRNSPDDEYPTDHFMHIKDAKELQRDLEDAIDTAQYLEIVARNAGIPKAHLEGEG